MPISNYQSIRCNIPENFKPQHHCCENLKTHNNSIAGTGVSGYRMDVVSFLAGARHPSSPKRPKWF